ncbi:MAG: hypothetical protein FWF41_03520 [Betaproteobacteria bacterium]|nr:hypothetical protein [Betaproteobacteria bacterium]
MSTSGIAIFLVLFYTIIPLEVLLSWKLNRFYFTIGLPLFKTEVGCGVMSNPVPSAEQLTEALSHAISEKMVFSPIGSHRFAFRGRFKAGYFHVPYLPVMHGSLLFDPLTGQVRVDGLANWYPFVVLAGVFFSSDSAPIPWGIFFLLIFLAYYIVQFRWFRAITKHAATCWAANKETAKGATGELETDHDFPKS